MPATPDADSAGSRPADCFPASETALLRDLEPVVAAEVDRHLSAATDWSPHQYVPWSRGRDFEFLGGEGWEPGDSTVSPQSREALLVNLLTEDNLPYYHSAISHIMGGDGAWGFWVNRWTAEEARHSIVIRDYLTVTRAVDPEELERYRMAHMQGGYQPDHGESLLRGLAYVSFQELATRVSHRNTGQVSGDPVCEQLMARVASDENLHMVFYRNVIAAAFEAAPDETMRAVADVVTGFQMPGHAIDGFWRKSVAIANAGIYDLRLHHDTVLKPVLRYWRVHDRTDLGPAGEAARERLAAHLETLNTAATRFEERRAERRARQAARRQD
ncbi:acyl-ACP desaturase [Actinomadura sp. K4S16]|uniref:acyl-ACP desaturase n=1 Tax=Actinomadura sp. K4S16 TaxID=1316147 RepID=UPI0011EC596A|nr:acyl-ACP desaturase [Actinomadura sp. K4S16]